MVPGGTQRLVTLVKRIECWDILRSCRSKQLLKKLPAFTEREILLLVTRDCCRICMEQILFWVAESH
jgi:hypothetical protein